MQPKAVGHIHQAVQAEIVRFSLQQSTDTGLGYLQYLRSVGLCQPPLFYTLRDLGHQHRAQLQINRSYRVVVQDTPGTGGWILGVYHAHPGGSCFKAPCPVSISWLRRL